MVTNYSLKLAFRTNALFSVLSATVMVLASSWVVSQLGGLSEIWLYAGAVALLVFAGQLIWMSLMPSQKSLLVGYVIVSDWLFVMGVVLGIFLYGEFISTTGHLMLIAVATAVALLALWQNRAWTTLTRTASS
ncbi:MAG: hypothetical protein JKY67_09920 [Pseudomonadales bacterium]|nr:hypothetical protein [Pseudomonadales bacterium]